MNPPFAAATRELLRAEAWSEAPQSLFQTSVRWRHHGLGMLQTEFNDALRVHVWHPDLVAPGMLWPRCVHDHRFRLDSAVVIGTVYDVPCALSEEAFIPGWERVHVYEIEHAKEQDRMVTKEGCSTATQARLIAKGSLQAANEIAYVAGETYTIERRAFHTTRVRGLAVTAVHRAHFDRRVARVLATPGADVLAVSGIVRDATPERYALIARVLDEAANALRALSAAP